MSDLPETLWGPLWRHMHDEHGLILLDDDCNQIAQACDESRIAAGTRNVEEIVDLADYLAHAIFAQGNECHDRVQRIQFMGGKYPDHETKLGGYCREALRDCIKRAIDARPRFFGNARAMASGAPESPLK